MLSLAQAGGCYFVDSPIKVNSSFGTSSHEFHPLKTLKIGFPSAIESIVTLFAPFPSDRKRWLLVANYPFEASCDPDQHC
jgi:hypothetical protein